jgi:hypothetical protein
MPSASPSASYHQYQQSMVALVERVREVDVGTFETAPREVLVGELQPRTSTLLAQANQLVRSVLEECELGESERIVGEPRQDFELALDRVIQQSPSSRIADIAFMAQVELRQRAARLDGLAPDPASILIAECDGALRRVTKALCALDRAMARASDTPAYLDYLSELELSLRVRACYARFRRRVLEGGDDVRTVEQVLARLRRTGGEIAVIVGLPVYPDLRLNDRMQLRGLQQRIIAWLSTGRDLGEGLSIWRDVSAFVAILRHVGRRQELFEHDARVVLGALESLARHGTISGPSFCDLLMLDGRDDDVDALIASGDRDIELWAPLLERLAREIGNRTPSSPP